MILSFGQHYKQGDIVKIFLLLGKKLNEPQNVQIIRESNAQEHHDYWMLERPEEYKLAIILNGDPRDYAKIDPNLTFYEVTTD